MVLLGKKVSKIGRWYLVHAALKGENPSVIALGHSRWSEDAIRSYKTLALKVTRYREFPIPFETIQSEITDGTR